MTTKKVTTKSARKKETLGTLAKRHGLPLPVRFWLQRYVETGEADEEVPTYWNSAYDDFARLVFDVLNAKHRYHGQPAGEFSEEAVDYVEAFLYRLAQDSDQQVWNNPDIAVAALTVLIDCSDNSEGMSATLSAVETDIGMTTTAEERCAYLTGPRWGRNDEDETNTEAAFKLSRLLADLRTPSDVRRQLGEMVINLCNAANIIVDHPALVRRAFLIACDQRPKGHVREVQRARRDLLALLDSTPEPDVEGGES